jgi:hypothetical protein
MKCSDLRCQDSGIVSETVKVRSATEIYALEIAEQAAQQALKGREDGNALKQMRASMVAVVFAMIAIEEGIKRATGNTFVKGVGPYQDFKLLKNIRNALVHYRPGWEGPEVDPVKVLKQAESPRRFELNEKASRWEEKAFSAGCAQWACQTAVAVVKKMYDLSPARGYPAGIKERVAP